MKDSPAEVPVTFPAKESRTVDKEGRKAGV